MKQYVVDAFTDTVFKGNPAAVCIMDSWIDDDLMLSITRENNLSETAFAVKENKKYRLRWFTPGGEIDLCGHATLATAFVITNFYEKNIDKIVFDTLSGELTVHKKEELFELVWEEPYLPGDNTLNTHLSNLRKKLAQLDPTEEYIETIWGVGYRFKA